MPAGLENLPRSDQKKEKSYCENTKKPATSFPSFDPFFFLNIFLGPSSGGSNTAGHYFYPSREPFTLF